MAALARASVSAQKGERGDGLVPAGVSVLTLPYLYFIIVLLIGSPTETPPGGGYLAITSAPF